MQEHTIPESLIDQIKAGRAVLVVGAGVGVPSWKQLLEKMNEQLAEAEPAGPDGDGDGDGDGGGGGGKARGSAASKDVARLLNKGSFSRAAGFLARALGEDTCHVIVAETWTTPEAIPEVVRAMARLPFRHVWTTFPGDVLEKAMAEERPEDWPAVEVTTYRGAGDLSTRRPALVKILGDLDSYLVTPGSQRRELSSAAGLLDYVRDFYSKGTLVLVGFRHGDPDLAVLLERLFASFERPAHHHYLVGSGLGPVAVDELEHEHHIEVIALPGKAGDDTANAALIEYLQALGKACEDAGVGLAGTEPDPDDLDGWLAMWSEDAEAARQAVARIADSARQAGDSERLIDTLVGRVEREDSATVRAGLLRQLADVFENQVGDLPQAFTALTAALREDPADSTAVDEAERLAADTDAWAELVADVSQVAGEIDDAAIAAGYWTRLGGWYMDRLDHADYAVAAYRQAIKLDKAQVAAYAALAEVFRKQQRWADLADVLGDHAAVEPDSEKKVDLYLALGDLYETQLASTARAIEAYQASAELDEHNDDALAALDRLYRKGERWDKLAGVLERRAAHLEQSDVQRAAALRRELATLRVEKLGDVEGAIARYEAALEADGGDVEALRALEGLYEKVGRSDDYLRTLDRLIEVSPEADRPTLLLRLAAEVEERDSDRAIEAYEKLLAIETTGPGAHNAYRALERLLGRRQRWNALAGAYQRHLDITREVDERIALLTSLAEVQERELDDPHQAIAALAQIREADGKNRVALAALARLQTRIAAWDRAVAALVELAELDGSGADEWHQAGAMITEHLGDLAAISEEQDAPRDWAADAETYLEKALELDASHRDTMLALARLHRSRSSWGNAVDLLTRAEGLTQNRLERVDLLTEAADLTERRLGDRERALALLQRVLELDPERVEAGKQVSERLLAAQRWEEAIPILEMLSRRSETDHERARAETALGRAHRALEEWDRAVDHYRRAVEADNDSMEVALGLGDMLFASARNLANQQDSEGQGEIVDARWRETEACYRELLARHRTSLADSQVVEIWHRVGVAERVLGNDKKAENAFRRALELDPHHVSTLEGLVQVATAREDWATVVEARRELLTRMDVSRDASGEARVDLLTAIGDILRDNLGDSAGALGAYLEALELAPGSYQLLHKTLELYTERGEWRPAIDTLEALARHDTSAMRRSRYRYHAAVFARDELHDADLAIERFELALDDAPDEKKAFDAVVGLLTERQDYKGLARAYRKMLQRLGEDASDDVLLALWSRLGEIYAEHLDNPEAAIAAMEVAASLEPDNPARHEELANLYLETGTRHRDEAIEELQFLLHAHPERVELYRALSDLYVQAGARDKAFCLARALAFLGVASDAERELYERYRGVHIAVAERRITEELWTRSIIHPDEDRHINAMFTALIGAIAATTAQPASAFELGDDERAEIGRDAKSVLGRVFKYASDILALDPEPHLFVRDDDDGIRVLNTREGAILVPSVLAGNPHASAKDDRALAFEVGRRLAYFRPERYINLALQSTARLESVYMAILSVTGVREQEPTGDAAKMAAHLKKTVPGAVLDQVTALARKLGKATRIAAITEWQAVTELTANRVGFILCNDLEIAARLIATAPPTPSSLPAKERLRDLLVYSVSEPYFAVRKHLGLGIENEQ